MAGFLAVIISLFMASTAMADPPFPDYAVTALPGETVEYDVAAENPSLGVSQVLFTLGNCFQSGPTSVVYIENNTTPGYTEVCKVSVFYSGGQGFADFVVTVGSSTPPDTTNPVVNITSPDDGSITSVGSAVLNYTVTDDDPSLTCNYADGTSLTLDEGVNSITVNCSDSAGNSGTDTTTLTYIPPDTTAPVVTITSPADGTEFTTNTATLTFGVEDLDPSPVCSQASGSEISLVTGQNTITVECTDAAGNIGSDSVTVTYTPPPPTGSPIKVKLENVTIREGDTNRTAVVPITLSRASTVPITLTYSTQGKKAKSDVDFVAVTDGSVTIPAGETSGEILITIIGDNIRESSENFFVIGDLTIESSAYAKLQKDKATVVITNDDGKDCNNGRDNDHDGHDDNHDDVDDGHDGHHDS